MKTYFDIRFEFDHDTIHDSIERQLALGIPDYICVADDEVLTNTRKDAKYRSAVNNGMFTVCDSPYVTKSIRLVHHDECEQYYSSHFFLDILSERKHRMMLLGSSEMELRGLRREMMRYNPDVKGMFVELPFGEIDDFDYRAIARMVNAEGADIIWIALDSPDQEIFMAKLKPFLKRGVMIGIGAAVKYFSGSAYASYGEAPAASATSRIAHHFSMMKQLPGMLVKEWFRASVKGKSTEVKERYAFQSI